MHIQKIALFLILAMSSQTFAKPDSISIDGSSTVFPITEAIAEEYRSVQPKVRINIGVSGTGGGFKKFTSGEIDINNASRKIKPSERKKAQQSKIAYAEIPVAFDGLTVVVNKKNTWAKDITPAELKKIWDRGSKVKLWSDIRASWPKKEITLYGPGPDSGTFDYFTKVINGKSARSRSDYVKSEDDNVLVKGVVGDQYAMGYFGYAYYKENSTTLSAVAVNGVLPTEETINNETYKPLARPVFIYVSKKSYARPEVKAFVDFYLQTAPKIVGDVGYVSLPKEQYQKAKALLQ